MVFSPPFAGLCSSCLAVVESPYEDWIDKQIWLSLASIGFDKMLSFGNCLSSLELSLSLSLLTSLSLSLELSLELSSHGFLGDAVMKSKTKKTEETVERGGFDEANKVCVVSLFESLTIGPRL